VFGDMALIRRLHHPHIAVLRIGDRATMGPHGAAVALELLESQICIPCHYGTWPDFFTGTPDDLRLLTKVPVVVPGFGETIEVTALPNGV
jgi:L-ascorbate metabolism protein UlaG (beta-lactamase superfamily)